MIGNEKENEENYAPWESFDFNMYILLIIWKSQEIYLNVSFCRLN